MNQVALFLYEMLCIREGDFLIFIKSQTLLSRSPVDDIISFLACK